MGKFKKIAYIILIAIILLLAFAIYTNAVKNEGEEQKQKASTEIRFLESKIIDLANKLNNIEFENYKISESEITKQSSKEESSSGGSSSGSSSDSSSKSGGSEESNGGSEENTSRRW